MISAAILQHNADRLCEEEHLLFTLHRAEFAICTSDITTFPTLLNEFAHLLSVARNAMISAAILQHNADRLCEEEHLLFTLHKAKFAICTSDVTTFPTLLN